NIKGFEGHYLISNKGNVKSIKKKTSKNLKLVKMQNGYYCVTLQNGESNRGVHYVHRLVGLHFLNKEERSNSINHKDGDKANNTVDNLEWCTHLENNRHAFDNDLIGIAIKVKLTRICDGKEFTFKSQKEASFFLNKSARYISRKKQENKSAVDDGNNFYRLEIL